MIIKRMNILLTHIKKNHPIIMFTVKNIQTKKERNIMNILVKKIKEEVMIILLITMKVILVVHLVIIMKETKNIINMKIKRKKKKKKKKKGKEKKDIIIQMTIKIILKVIQVVDLLVGVQ